ncbi:S-locus-specific glycoprotein S13-like [Macadamia integrifolia]|uniref:S-locus-specific glycoprotein S13-like n=1 Tax=Macadamia integrifolia TaxID=60698 RepID=UPI001C4FC4C0|nr:S-locus-specific glycoprotein S13-like [Macadamia integrifolia]
MGFSNSRVSSTTLLSCISLPCLYLFLLLPNCIAIDTISASQSIKDGETLVSAGGIFELGFFSPANSANRYVGIWYKNTSYTQVVSVLNSKKPISDSGGSLAINSTIGNLILLDGKQNLIWCTNASSTLSRTDDTLAATLEDTGNFALRENNSSRSIVLWQSFDYPSNTLIPNMKLGGNNELGISLTLTSWESESNPAPGNFFLRRNRRPLQQIYIMSGSAATIMNGSNEVKHWNSGPWNGQNFVGIPGMNLNYINGITFSYDGNGGEYYTISSPGDSSISIGVLDSSGNFETKEWDEQKKIWVNTWYAINSECDVYGTCGGFGVCNIKMESSSICSCMKGFQPKDQEKWRKGNWSDGCVRSDPLECGSSNEGFLKLEGVKLPDLADYIKVEDVNECNDRCLKNCSCVAYAYISGPGCLVWSADLIDVQQFSSGGQDLFLRLPSSELGTHVHIGEYGVHWNFFFTLAAVSILTFMANIQTQNCGTLGSSILLGYQTCLLYGLNEYLLSSRRGKDIISQNKEGIFSIFGYWGLYLVGIQLGNYLFFGNDSTSMRNIQWARKRVWILTFLFWFLTIILDKHVEKVSRRMCNLAYVTFVLAQNFQVLGLLLLSDFTGGQKISVLEEAFNRNLLASFLMANVLTGVINLCVDTISASSVTAFIILLSYAFVLSVLTGSAEFVGIGLKFW